MGATTADARGGRSSGRMRGFVSTPSSTTPRARHPLLVHQHKRSNRLRLRRNQRPHPSTSVLWAQSQFRRFRLRQRPLLRLQRRYRNLVQLLRSRAPLPYQQRRSPREARALHCRKPRAAVARVCNDLAGSGDARSTSLGATLKVGA